MSVFGALNRLISRLDSDPSPNAGLAIGTYGFQCLRNKNHEIALEPWYDFIIGINGRQITDANPSLFATEVRNCAGSTVTLTCWSAKGQRVRDLHLPVPIPSPTLGLTLQWSSRLSTENVWHILDVIPNSPADNAGLLPYGDYIVGTPEGLVHGEAGLGELVEDYLSRPLRLYVYNHEYAVTRVVTITPSRNWGGNGALGCVLGFGALHSLPSSLLEPPAAPGDMLFETARMSSEQRADSATDSISLSSPAGFLRTNTSTPPPFIVSAVPPRASRKQRQGISPNRAFDEYFQESEKRGQKEDPSPAVKVDLPPPPKTGGMKFGKLTSIDSRQKNLEVQTNLLIPPPSGGEPRQTRSPDPILDDDGDEDEDQGND